MGKNDLKEKPEVAKKTFRFDADLQAVFDGLKPLIRKDVSTKYYLRGPSEQEYIDFILRDYTRLKVRSTSVLAGSDEG